MEIVLYAWQLNSADKISAEDHVGLWWEGLYRPLTVAYNQLTFLAAGNFLIRYTSIYIYHSITNNMCITSCQPQSKLRDAETLF